MADDIDILLNMHAEQWTHVRHTEDQRATVTNIVLLITSVVIGFIAQKGLSVDVLPLTLMLLILGIYGAITSEKLYEITQMHLERGRFLRRRIDEINSTVHLAQTMSDAKVKHRTKFRRLYRLRLHYLWLFMHLSIALAGIILSLIVIFL